MDKKNPVGRPKKTTSPKLFRLPDSLLEKLEVNAEKEKLTLSAYVIQLLSKAVE